MRGIDVHGLIVRGLAGCLVVLVAADAKAETPKLAHFRFDGNAKDEDPTRPGFDLKNTQFTQQGLYLNGIYEAGGFGAAGGYHAVCRTPELDTSAFSVVLRFKPEAFAAGSTNLLTGGISGRWFGLESSRDGKLMVTLNNRRYIHEIAPAAMSAGQWTLVACSVDFSRNTILVYYNGAKAAEIDLSNETKLAIANLTSRGRDKLWSFANYSNGNVFYGYVDELIIYGKALSEDQLATFNKAAPDAAGRPGRRGLPAAIEPTRPADDFYAVPNGDVETLMVFIRRLRGFRPSNPSEMTAHRSQGPAAIAAAAKRILAFMPDDSSEASTSARLILLGPRLSALPTLTEDERATLIGELEAALKDKARRGLEPDDVKLALSVARSIEYGGASPWAAEVHERLARIIGSNRDAYAAQTQSLLGTARRLNLVGQEMTLKGETTAGAAFDWGSYRGKVVLVNFWAASNDICLSEMPHIRALYDKYHDRGFEVVGISLDHDRAALNKFLAEKAIPWTTLHQQGLPPAVWDYGIKSIPAGFLVGRDGKVVSIRAVGVELKRLVTDIFDTAAAHTEKPKLTERGANTSGHSTDDDAITKLADSDPTVRIGAVMSILKHPPAASKAVPALRSVLNESGVGLWAIRALGQYGVEARSALEDLRKLIRDNSQGNRIYNAEVRQLAAEAVWKISNRAEDVIPILMLDFRELLGDGLHGAARILVAMGPSAAETAPVLIEILENDRSQGRRQLAARILGTFGPKAEPAIPALSETAADEKNLLLLRQEADDVLKKLNATATMRSITNEGKVIWLPLQHASQVQAVAFSHDGSLLATASSPPNGNSTIRLWDVKTGAEKAPLREDHRRLTDCLAFSPDDKSLASSGGSVVIWNLETRRPHNVDAHKFASGDLAFSPDGSTLAIAGPDDREIALWDLKNDKLAGVLRGHKGYVRSVAFAPDGKTLVSGGNDVPNVRIWNVPSRRQLAALSHPAYAEAVAYFPDGKWFAAGNSFGDNTVRIWDAISHKERRVLRGHTQFIHAIAISPDGTTLASAGDDATIRLWETATGAERTVFKGHFGPVYALSFSRDGSLLASGGADNTVRLWSVAMRNGRR